MIATVLRTLGAIAAGLCVVFALAVAVGYFSSIVHRFPDGFAGTPEELRQHLERYPT
jgi:chromate transport protein ChrA